MNDICFGPWLRFDSRTDDNVWQLTALVVAAETYNATTPPQIEVQSVGPFTGTLLDSFGEYHFWRFVLHIPMETIESQHQYTLHFDPPLPNNAAFTLTVPGIAGGLNWGFKSCDWFSGGVTAEQQAQWGGHMPCWNDILTMHKKNPLHLMVNGGDQVYCDPVFKEVAELKSWAALTDMRDMHDALKYQPTAHAADDISAWYFTHYCKSFQRDGFLQVMSSIPQISMYDDHDIWDGWGSYPAALQNCPMFQTIWAVAERFYLLFQQHTTKALAYKHGFFGAPAYHFVKQPTPEFAVVGMDMRAQRTLKHVIPPEGHTAIMQELSKLPATVRHLVVISAVPVVYPEVPLSETSMKCLTLWHRHVSVWAMRNRQAPGSLFKFGQAELTDDLVDHWGSSCHRKERKALIERFQHFAAARGVRVSWISGDVHLAAVGLLYSHPKALDPTKDPRWMLNVTSSASVNLPPPNGLVTTMTKTSRAGKINHVTREKMIRMFKDVPGALSDKLMPRRNWCHVLTEPLSAGGNMVFTLRVEPQGPEPSKPNFERYSITAPMLK